MFADGTAAYDALPQALKALSRDWMDFTLA